MGEGWEECVMINRKNDMKKYELHNGDCLEYMKKIPTSSVDLIITDPTYNLGKFMENRDTNLGKMRDNFFGIAGWDDLEYIDTTLEKYKKVNLIFEK